MLGNGDLSHCSLGCTRWHGQPVPAVMPGCRDSPAVPGREYPGSVPRPGAASESHGGFLCWPSSRYCHRDASPSLPRCLQSQQPQHGSGGASGLALHLALAEWEAIRAVKVTADLVLSNVDADIQTVLQGGKPRVWVVNTLVLSCPNSPSGEPTLAGINGLNQPILVPLITIHAAPLFIPLRPQHIQGRGLQPQGSMALPSQG